MKSVSVLGCVLGLFLVGQAPAFADTAVNVSLWDKGMNAEMPTNMELGVSPDLTNAPLGIRLDRKTVRPGKVIFRVRNDSKDMTHEMIIAAISDPAKPLPYLSNESRVNESAIKDLGEVSELEPGKSGELALTLAPGTYVLFCNVPAHMTAGMWALLTVGN